MDCKLHIWLELKEDLNQDVLLRSWAIIIVVIALEIGLALYKLLKGQWTKKMASFNTILELFVTVVFIVILSNPNLINQEFIKYMSKLFSTTTKQFEIWIVGGGINHIYFICSNQYIRWIP